MASVFGLKGSIPSLNSRIADSPCAPFAPLHCTSLLRKNELKGVSSDFSSLSASFVKNQEKYISIWSLRAASEEVGIVEAETKESEEPITLATVTLTRNVDLSKLERWLFKWGNAFVECLVVPPDVPLKVQAEKVKGGVRLQFTRSMEGKLEDILHIDCLVFPATKGSSAMFCAQRNGWRKHFLGALHEAKIMIMLLKHLRKAIKLCSAPLYEDLPNGKF